MSPLRAALRLALALALPLPLAGCGTYSYTKVIGPHAEKLPYTIKTSQERHVEEAWPNDEYRLSGLDDAEGRKVLPVEFRELRFLSKDRVLARREDRSIALVTLPEGTIDETRYERYAHAELPYGAPQSEAIPYLTSARSADGRFDVTLLVDGAPRPPIHDVGGASMPEGAAWTDAVWRQGSCLVIHSTGEGGRALSRVYTLGGQPLGPSVDRLPGLPYAATIDKALEEGRPEWVLPGGTELAEAGLPWRVAYRPLGNDGDALALPAGAVGMAPIPYLDDLHHAAWAIVLDAPAGRRYLVGPGRATAVASRDALPSLVRCEGLHEVRRYWQVHGKEFAAMRLFAWRREGAPGWELVSTETLQPWRWKGGEGTFATFEALLAAWDALDAAERARPGER